MNPSNLEEFWRHVAVGKQNECWLWTHRKNRDGYGTLNITVGVRTYKALLAHRRAWEITRGEIPDGKIVCHKCDNPACVNPAHLWVGTHADNVRDKVRKGRHPRGENASSHKLSESDVVSIKARLPQGVRSDKLAAEYAVSPVTISDIKRGITWRHITADSDNGKEEEGK
jgi:hypothetical protein